MALPKLVRSERKLSAHRKYPKFLPRARARRCSFRPPQQGAEVFFTVFVHETETDVKVFSRHKTIHSKSNLPYRFISAGNTKNQQVTMEDIFTGNGVSELINLSKQSNKSKGRRQSPCVQELWGRMSKHGDFIGFFGCFQPFFLFAFLTIRQSHPL